MNNFNRGFTLIELLVSVAIFVIVMVSVSASYLNLINLDRQARATDDVVNNLSFALDSMSRAIRTGYDYQCGGVGHTTCTSPSDVFTFDTSEGAQTTYELNTNTHQIEECNASNDCSAFTDSRITINSLEFYDVSGTGESRIQPQVVFTVNGTLAEQPETNVNFDIETTATQRNINISL